MGKERSEPFKRYGNGGELVLVKAKEILDAIAEGRDIYIRYAIIDGDLDISEIASKILDQQDQDENSKLIVKGKVSILISEIRGDTRFSFDELNSDVRFSSTTFNKNVSFTSTKFGGFAGFRSVTFSEGIRFTGAVFKCGADFREAIFSEDADFIAAVFNGPIYFSVATFTRHTYFRGAHLKYPANFAGVRFKENTVPRGLWNYILRPVFRPIIWFLTIGKIKLPEMTVTDFYDFNTVTTMDGSSNPYLKRYIDDEQWIASWRKRSKLRRFLFCIWELTSHCGRSIGLWAFWSAAIAVAFAFIYRWFGSESIAFSIDKLGGEPGFWGYLYYSVVTFTTLGFGDIVPLTNSARLAVGAEVVLGYVMLGGLISIFANKLARRS